ncbi:MAG TPA: DUF4129 domain-containing protein [Terracidiphilus sp.]|nr:DUF4129 domain-containing protein [Terracidiphilus sp.]
MGLVLLALGAGVAPSRAQQLQAEPEPGSANAQDVSADDYRKHLLALETLTQACAKARDTKSCEPELVGSDDRVPLGTEAKASRRLIRYGWLRTLYARGQLADEPRETPKPGSPESPWGTPRTTSQLLADAQTRLADDLAEADASPGANPSRTVERAVLTKVLAGREFRKLKQQDAGESLLERFSNWLNRQFEKLGRLQVHAAWVGRALFWGFLLAVGVGLAWALIQLERRWRVRLVPDVDRPPEGAPSARDWQLWLKDAREAAAAGRWREAIHFIYWSAISRLESKRLWPPDRARTPREYLALVAGDDPRKAGLGALTREFEWTWYGGRQASETDYQRAEEHAAELLETAGTDGARGGAA